MTQIKKTLAICILLAGCQLPARDPETGEVQFCRIPQDDTHYRIGYGQECMDGHTAVNPDSTVQTSSETGDQRKTGRL